MTTFFTSARIFQVCGLFLTVWFLHACSENTTEPKPALQIPTTYDSTTYSANTTAEYAMRSAVTSMSTLLKTARTAGTKLDAATLKQNFNTTLQPLTTQSGAERVGMLLEEIAKASGNTYDPRKTPAENGEGGLFGGYVFDENGLDVQEAVEKLLFGSTLYYHALQLSEGTVKQENLDRIIASFGAHPKFSNTNAATVNPDVLCAGYAARRDKNDGNGYYTQFKKNIIKAQAALKAGSSYNQELNEALIAARQNWEKSQIATAINYLYATLTGFSATNPDDKALASALHSYGEATNFLWGFRAVPQSGRIITDAQIADILATVYYPVDGVPAPHKFINDAFNSVPALEAAVKKLQAVYGFTDAEVADFKKNWVTEQGRK